MKGIALLIEVTFCIAVIGAVLFVYLPGYAVLRAARLSRWLSMVCAPAVSLCAYNILTIAYAKAGVFCTWATLFIPVLVVGIAAFVVSRRVGKHKALSFDLGFSSGSFCLAGHTIQGFSWWLAGWYVVCGIVITSFVFLSPVASLEGFSQSFDNVHHMAQIYGSVTSGNWSPLEVTMYPGEDAHLNVLQQSGFYPSSWQIVAAMLVSSLDISTPLAVNATNAAFIMVVYPLCVCVFLRRLFHDQGLLMVFGALTALSFTAFPWTLLYFGPIYSNMAAYCLIPLAVALFMSIFERGITRQDRVRAAILFCIAALALAFTQPVAALTVGVMMISYVVYQSHRLVKHFEIFAGHVKLGYVVVGAITCVALIVVWVAIYNLPFLAGVVNHEWALKSAKAEAIYRAASLTFLNKNAQPILAILVIVGALYTLRRREYLWATFSYGLLGICYVMCMAGRTYVLRHFLSGFWYTDAYRVAAAMVLIGFVLAALGCFAVYKVLSMLGCKLVAKRTTIPVKAISAGIVFVLLIVNFYPGVARYSDDNPIPKDANAYEGLTGMGELQRRIMWAYAVGGPMTFDRPERAFVDATQDVIEDDALVINEPNDGSAFAYGAYGLNTYYRPLRPYNTEGETPESRIIRLKLNEYATNPEVQKAVENIDADYVIQLDQGGAVLPDRKYLFTYDPADWVGIITIDETTPGFDLVLSDGDMCLYKIER